MAFGRGILLGRNNNQFTAANPPLVQTDEHFIKPTAFYRKESPCEIQILLSEDLKSAPAVTEQFFLSLSSSQAPQSFELVADHKQITLQMACDNGFTADLRNQLSSFFPGIFISEVGMLAITEPLLSKAEAAFLLGVLRMTLHRKRKAGVIGSTELALVWSTRKKNISARFLHKARTGDR